MTGAVHRVAGDNRGCSLARAQRLDREGLHDQHTARLQTSSDRAPQIALAVVEVEDYVERTGRPAIMPEIDHHAHEQRPARFARRTPLPKHRRRSPQRVQSKIRRCRPAHRDIER